MSRLKRSRYRRPIDSGQIIAFEQSSQTTSRAYHESDTGTNETSDRLTGVLIIENISIADEFRGGIKPVRARSNTAENLPCLFIYKTCRDDTLPGDDKYENVTRGQYLRRYGTFFFSELRHARCRCFSVPKCVNAKTLCLFRIKRVCQRVSLHR